MATPYPANLARVGRVPDLNGASGIASSTAAGEIRDASRFVLDPFGRRWSISAPEHSIFQLTPSVAADLRSIARRMAVRHRKVEDINDIDLLVDAEVAMRQGPQDLLSALVRYRLGLDGEGVMLLRGLPIDEALPATPRFGAFGGSWRDLSTSTIIQLMIMSVLGDVIAYAEEKEGRLIQDICPVQGKEQHQENTGSCLLELHTEDGFHPMKPHFISLLSLRSDHDAQAMTVSAGIRQVLARLDPNHARVLREPLFPVRVASSFGNSATTLTAPIPVLRGTPTDPDLCVDFHATLPMTQEAEGALEHLRLLFLDSLVGAVLYPGDMLIVDNRKSVHGRSSFSPRYDDNDRWLRRCFAVTDIRKAHALDRGSRVHPPLDYKESLGSNHA